MKTGRPTDYIKLRRYKRLAATVAYEGGNLKEFAERAGVSAAFATRYLKQRAPEHHRALKDNARYAALHPLVVLSRLRVIAQSRTKTIAAKRLNLTLPGLSNFLKRYAPDGVTEALPEYEEAYGAPLFEEAA